MDVQAVSGPIQEQDVDAIIVYLFADKTLRGATRTVDDVLDGALTDLIVGGDFEGQSDQVAVLYPRGAIPSRRVILAGLGALDEFTVDTVRRAAAQGVKKARDRKAETVTTAAVGSERADLDVETAARAITEGALLGLYTYHGQKTNDVPPALPQTLNIRANGESDLPRIKAGIRAGTAVSRGTSLARDLVNLPPNICTPLYLAQVATDMAQEVGLTLKVLEEKQIRSLKMGALLAVAQGSDTPPRFIVLEHNVEQADEHDTIVLVGKGVTFDTGGYTLKTRDGMLKMKADMAGAAAVLGAMRIIAESDMPQHVVGLVPAADNMISGHAYRPTEVVTAGNGKTIEVISTDAEGRMLLADALVYAGRYKPAAVIDIATLTSACVVALGTAAAGVFSTDERLRDRLIEAGTFTHERVWPLPLFAQYDEAIKSQTADIKNTGGRMDGVGTSAAFLHNFVDYPAWAHVDMAGMMVDARNNPYVPAEGATGYGARLLSELVRRWSQGQPE